jgi:putative two-component system response regulator
MNVKKAIVLIVDEASDNLIEMNRLLQKQYEIRLANSGRAALSVMQQVPRPHLVVLDTALPDIDGYTVCQQLKSNPDTADIPVIFLQTQAEDDQERALMEGGADVVAKPVVGDVLRARVDTHLQLRHSRELLKQQRNLLEHVVEEVTLELSQMLDAMIWALASLAETREYETPNHLRRVQHYVVALARPLQGHKRISEEHSDANNKTL